MSHGACGGFADQVDPSNIVKLFPDMEPLFEAVTSHEAWKLLECTTMCHFDKIQDVLSELRDVIEMEEDETDSAYDKRVNAMARSFREAFRKLQLTFRARVGAEIDTDYLDEDSLDGYAEIRGRYWHIYDHQVLRPKVAKAVKKGLKLERKFYAVYG